MGSVPCEDDYVSPRKSPVYSITSLQSLCGNELGDKPYSGHLRYAISVFCVLDVSMMIHLNMLIIPSERWALVCPAMWINPYVD